MNNVVIVKIESNIFPTDVVCYIFNVKLNLSKLYIIFYLGNFCNKLYCFSLSLLGLPLFNNVVQSTITPSYKPDNVTNRLFNGQPSVYIQQVTHFK